MPRKIITENTEYTRYFKYLLTKETATSYEIREYFDIEPTLFRNKIKQLSIKPYELIKEEKTNIRNKHSGYYQYSINYEGVFFYITKMCGKREKIILSQLNIFKKIIKEYFELIREEKSLNEIFEGFIQGVGIYSNMYYQNEELRKDNYPINIKKELIDEKNELLISLFILSENYMFGEENPIIKKYPAEWRGM